MVPLKLCIKNFLSYGDLQEVDFTGHHLICLSGKNGHGKSALLDALTWAVWGQARKLSGSCRADQGLLRLGQRHMMVSVDFRLNDCIYRIKRELNLSRGKVTISLDFGMHNNNNSFISLTDKTVRTTQQKIDDTIRLTFDTFVNSAFLRQGQANEFSKKSPKERKDIFAAILGMTTFDEIKKLAVEKSRHAVTQHQFHTMIQDQLQHELTKKNECEQRHRLLLQEVAQALKDEELIKEQSNLLAQEKSALYAQQHQHEIVQVQHRQLCAREMEQKKLLQDHYRSWKLITKNYSNIIDYHALLDRKKKVLALINEHQQNLQESFKNQKQLAQLTQQMQELIRQYQAKEQVQIQENKITFERLLSTKASNMTQQEQLIKQQKSITSQLEEINTCIKEWYDLLTTKDEHDVQVKILEAQFEKRKAAYQEFSALGNWLTNELHIIEQKKDMVGNPGDPSCPLCEQNLSATRRRFLHTKLGTQEQAIAQKLSRLTLLVKKLKPMLIHQHQLLEQAKTHATMLISCEANCRAYEEKKSILLAQYTVLNQEIDTHKNKLVFLEDSLQHIDNFLQKTANINQLPPAACDDPIYQKLHDQIKIIEKSSTPLSVLEKMYKTAQNELAAIEHLLHDQENFRLQAAQQQFRLQEIEKIAQVLKVIKQEKVQQEITLQSYNDLADFKQKIVQQEDDIQERQRALRTRIEALFLEKGSLESALIQFNSIETDLHNRQKAAAHMREMATHYQTIAHAISKDGIQALLIEDTIPEVEQEANRLLSKLTNNQAHLFIESLRDLKRGGVKETLDIKISDAIGIRPYEMFSGGEAFRIDFALRIALSKLLARRAGTTLQTLIIDEGFGSQDEEGLAHIMDAIHALQEDFEKVIIVSHLDVMKDQFPVHLLVEKKPTGSIVKIIEND